MSNLFNYLKKYGNQTFKEFHFNEVDSLILSQLSYLNLNFYCPLIEDHQDNVSLQSALTKENIDRFCENTLFPKRNKKLLNVLKNTSRYEGIYMNYHRNYSCPEKVEQFSAITFLFQDFVYIAYRGTDLTLLGWKENFTMAFLDVIPSQVDAARYLDHVGQCVDVPIYVGGHSKGGNLAIYASLYCHEHLQQRIVKVFNHDGPGFSVDIFSTPPYIKIQSKIEKTTCKESIIGILLYHNENIKYVDSRSIGIFQHNPFNWKITKKGRFKLVKGAKLLSRVFAKTVNELIETTPKDDRKLFLEAVFRIAIENDQEIVLDLTRHPFRYISRIHKNFKLISSEQQNLIKDILKKYRKLWNANLKYYLNRKIHFKHQ